MRIKDWNKFQHFKDRRPPWIKLYRDLLDDPEWHELDPSSAKVLVMIWLIASEEMGELPTIKKLAFRLRIPEKQVENHCSKLSHWLIQDDINVISGCNQHDAPETETEGETKKETEVPNGTCPASRTPSQRLLDLFHEKCDYLPKVAVFSEARKRTLQARFKEVMKSEGWEADKTIEWFGEFYGIVNSSRFLTGRAPPGRDGRAFKADWDWIHAPSNFVKIVEGKYTGD